MQAGLDQSSSQWRDICFHLHRNHPCDTPGCRVSCGQCPKRPCLTGSHLSKLQSKGASMTTACKGTLFLLHEAASTAYDAIPAHIEVRVKEMFSVVQSYHTSARNHQPATGS